MEVESDHHTQDVTHGCMDCSHLNGTYHWLESQLFCDPKNAELWWSPNDLIKIKRDRGREEEEEGEEMKEEVITEETADLLPATSSAMNR